LSLLNHHFLPGVRKKRQLPNYQRRGGGGRYRTIPSQGKKKGVAEQQKEGGKRKNKSDCLFSEHVHEKKGGRELSG